MPKMRASALPVIAVAAALSLASLARAGNPPEPQDLELVGRQLESSKARQSEIASRIEELEKEQQSLTKRLTGLAQKVQSFEAAITSAEEQLTALDAQQRHIKAGLLAKREALSELLGGLQRLGANPPPALVAEPGDILNALRGAILLGAVVPELNAEARELTRTLARLETVRAETRKTEDGIRASQVKLDAARKDLKGLLERKKALVKDAGRSLEAERKRSEDLAKKSKTLRELLAAIAEDKRKQAAADAEAAVEKAREDARRAAMRQRPKMAFADALGKLDFPAQGKVVRRFGEPGDLGAASKGLTVATRASAEVVAPVDGQVEFAGPFRSYGQLLILNAGGGYHVLMSGMGRISAVPGQRLEAGEPVAEMASGGDPATVTGGGVQKDAPLLYIEFRKNGEAVDSAPWWIGGAQEARG
jgi:murein hydrolase activator